MSVEAEAIDRVLVELQGTPTRVLTYQMASRITPSRPEWLWKHWLLARSVNLIIGRQGSGKTTFAAHLVASLVNGRALPGDVARDPIRVAILSLEEPKDRLVARLRAAGADLDRVPVLGDVEDHDDEGKSFRRPWRLPGDVAILGSRISDLNLGLVVVDGLGYSISGDSHNYAIVGSALSALASEAERTGAAILGLVHPPKGSSDPVTAAIGSTAWTAIPRLSIVLGADPNDETGGRRAVKVAKTNYKEPDTGYSFSISSDPEWECGYVTGMTPCDISAEAITSTPDSADARNEQGEIAAILGDLTGAGPVTLDEVRKVLKDAGYGVSDRTVQRARKRAGLVVIPPTRFGGKRSIGRPEHASTQSGQHSLDTPSSLQLSRLCPDDATRGNGFFEPSVDSPGEESRLMPAGSEMDLVELGYITEKAHDDDDLARFDGGETEDPGPIDIGSTANEPEPAIGEPDGPAPYGDTDFDRFAFADEIEDDESLPQVAPLVVTDELWGVLEPRVDSLRADSPVRAKLSALGYMGRDDLSAAEYREVIQILDEGEAA